MTDPEDAALIGEIQRLYTRLTPAATSSAMNAVSSLAVGAGAIAATQVPEAFITIPVFWSAWLFHSLILDLEALKDGAHLRWLEKIANQRLTISLFISETELTRRDQYRRPLVFYASFVYTALLTVGSWVAATWILIERGHDAWAWVSGAVAATVVSVAAWTTARRSSYARDYDRRLPQLPWERDPQPPADQTLRAAGATPDADTHP